MRARFPTALLSLLLLLSLPAAASAQEASAAGELIALADRALEAISQEDMVGLTDLMVEEASIYSVGERDGQPVLRYRDRAQERAMEPSGDLVERGFDPTVMVDGRIGMVWLPYDFYVDGEWSHCGVDIFTMLRGNEGWKIVSIAYTVDQPPACEPHPDGPPLGSDGEQGQK